MNKYAVYAVSGALIHINADRYRTMDGFLSFRQDIPDTSLSKEKALFAPGQWVHVIDCGEVEDKDGATAQ